MLGKLLNPLTTATSVGVAVRYLSTIIGAVLAFLGLLGWLSPEQVDALTQAVPEVLAALGLLWAAGIPIYAIFTKSSSDVAAKVAKEVDARVLRQGQPAMVPTPPGLPDIEVRPRSPSAGR